MKSPISTELAELLGMHAGDGTLYKISNGGAVWEMRGNHDEREFYDYYVIPLISKLGFALTGHVRSGGKNGCYGVRCCKKEFRQLLLDAGFGFGTKTKTVKVPECVMEGSFEVKAAFLRGLFATDGCAYIESREPHYPFIEFASASQQLRDDTKKILEELGILSYVWTHIPKERGGPSHHLRLAGIRKLRLFQEKIGLANPKHLKRVSMHLE